MGGAVVESVTAVEIFVATLLRLDLERRGRERGRIEGALQADFKSKLNDHVARKIFSVRFDAHAPSNPLDRWYAGAYELRGSIVHRGSFASADQAREAFGQIPYLGCTPCL